MAAHRDPSQRAPPWRLPRLGTRPARGGRRSCGLTGDHAAALDVITRNSDDSNCIGVTDAASVVLADRYRTTRLLTLDQRHFRRLRPLWGADYFTLLPYDS
jgi:hypothetical protein